MFTDLISGGGLYSYMGHANISCTGHLNSKQWQFDTIALFPALRLGTGHSLVGFGSQRGHGQEPRPFSLSLDVPMPEYLVH